MNECLHSYLHVCWLHAYIVNLEVIRWPHISMQSFQHVLVRPFCTCWKMQGFMYVLCVMYYISYMYMCMCLDGGMYVCIDKHIHHLHKCAHMHVCTNVYMSMSICVCAYLFACRHVCSYSILNYWALLDTHVCLCWLVHVSFHFSHWLYACRIMHSSYVRMDQTGRVCVYILYGMYAYMSFMVDVSFAVCMFFPVCVFVRTYVWFECMCTLLQRSCTKPQFLYH